MGHINRRQVRRSDGSLGVVGWQASYRAPDGRERTKTFRRKVDADRFLTSVEHSKLSGAYVDPAAGRTTVRAYAEEWRKVQPHRESTIVGVEQDLRLHVYPTLGDRPIAAVRNSEVQALVTGLSARLAPTTLERVYGRVTSVFRAAVRDRLIPATPCVDVRLPRRHTAAVSDVLTTDQVLALADAMPPRYRAVILAGAGTGLRPGELFGLALDRIDFLRRSVRVDQQLVRSRGVGVRLGPPKTPASYRTVPLAAMVGEVLAAHLTRWPAHDGLGLVFTNERGGPIQQQPFASAWATGSRRADLPSWATPHDLRHYYASLLIRSGASVKVIQTRLGHASAKVTLDVYGHLFPDEEDRTRAAVEDELRSGDQMRRGHLADIGGS
jgi:integrase